MILVDAQEVNFSLITLIVGLALRNSPSAAYLVSSSTRESAENVQGDKKSRFFGRCALHELTQKYGP
jgi:hypothetical protein